MKELNDCISLYKEAFGEEEEEFTQKLFEYCFKYCRFLKENGKVVSMLFTLPCKLNQNDCYYIYAAATLKSERGKGYMSRLLNEIKAQGIPLFLRPAGEKLISYYNKLGFKAVIAKKTKNGTYISPSGDFLKLCNCFPESETEESYTAMYFSKTVFFQNGFNFIYIME